MSMRGGEAKQVDVSDVTAYPSNPQIDLTGNDPMTPSSWLFVNLHASVKVYVSDDKKGEYPVPPGMYLTLDSGARKFWVRAQATGVNVKLEWSAS